MKTKMKRMRPTFTFLKTVVMVIFLMAGDVILAKAEIITPAEFAIIMDHESGEILYEKNADAPMKPASMAKMMTTYIIFQQLSEGSLELDDKLIVSNNAYRKGGSRMFLEQGSQVMIGELLRGIIVQSGNDAAIVVAEGLAGTEDAFAEEMTLRGKQLGMTNTVFGNSTGWPHEATTTTARDLAILAQALIRDFPDLYPIYSEKSYEYNGIKQNNRNPLIYNMDGADGLKTGHTEESGYGLVGSAEIDGQRIVVVINGLNSSAERKLESARLLTLAFKVFERYEIVKSDEVVGNVPVYLGVTAHVDLMAKESYSRVLARKSYTSIVKTTDWSSPVDAPIKKGQKIGTMTVTIDDKAIRIPLVAAYDVDQLPWYRRIIAFFKYLIFGAETVPQE